MSTLLSGSSKPLRWTLVCGATAMALSARGASPEAVPSQLLSDDERIDFCTQMHRASTPQERNAVAARMRDTLTPRAKGQGVALPAWVLEGRPANGSADIPGLSCQSGAARPRAPTAIPAPVPTPAPVRDMPERKPPQHEPQHEAATREPAPHQPGSHEPPNYPVSVNQPAAQRMPAPTPAPPPADDTSVRNTTPNGIPVAHDNHGIAYVTGGVGQDEVAAFRGLASGYNMRATFTTGSGEYLSGVAVQVARPDGTVVFSATSDGPYLFARLPQGRYRLTANLDGAQRSRELYVPARGGVRFTMVWPMAHASSAN
jgi:hypothetical protein